MIGSEALSRPYLASAQGAQPRDSGAIVSQLGKRKHTPPCSSAELFFAEKKWGPQRKGFGGGCGFPGFYRVSVSTTGLESFLLGQRSSPKDFLSVVVVYAFFFSAQTPLEQVRNKNAIEAAILNRVLDRD